MSGISTRAAGHGEMLVWSLLIGTSFPIAEYLVRDAHPLPLTGVRFLIAALLLVSVATRVAINPRRLIIWAILGALLAVFFWAQFHALRTVGSIELSLLYLLSPPGTAILAWYANREYLHPVPLAAFALVLYLVIQYLILPAPTDLVALLARPGSQVYLLGCAAVIGYAVLSRGAILRNWLPAAAATTTFWSLLFAGVLLCLVGVTRLPEVAQWHWDHWWRLVYLAVFTSILSYWLMQRALQKLHPAIVVAYGAVVPLWVALLPF